MVTYCRLQGVGLKYWRDEISQIHPDQPQGSPSLLCNGYWVSLPGGKADRGIALTSHPSVPAWHSVGHLFHFMSPYA